MKRTVTLVSLALLALGAARTAMASDGRISIGAVPFTVTALGEYYLSADLTYSGTRNAIGIQMGGATLDLRGHGLAASNTSATLIHFDVAAFDLTVTNVSLKGGGYGIYIGTNAAGTLRLDGLTIVGPANTGIYISGPALSSPILPTADITNCTIYLPGGASPTARGMYLVGIAAGRVVSNVVSGAGAVGTHTKAGIVIGLSTGLLVEGNSTDHLQYGLEALSATGITFRKNTAGASAYGLYCSNSQTVLADQNMLSGNTYGFYFTGGGTSTGRNNVAVGNATANYNLGLCMNGGGNL